MRVLMIIAVSFLFSTDCLAGSVAGQVERIYPSYYQGTPVVNFRLKNDSCKLSGLEGNTYWRFNLETEAEKAWYTMLLTSAVTGKVIRVGVPDGCDPNQNQFINYVYQDF